MASTAPAVDNSPPPQPLESSRSFRVDKFYREEFDPAFRAHKKRLIEAGKLPAIARYWENPKAAWRVFSHPDRETGLRKYDGVRDILTLRQYHIVAVLKAGSKVNKAGLRLAKASLPKLQQATGVPLRTLQRELAALAAKKVLFPYVDDYHPRRSGQRPTTYRIVGLDGDYGKVLEALRSDPEVWSSNKGHFAYHHRSRKLLTKAEAKELGWDTLLVELLAPEAKLAEETAVVHDRAQQAHPVSHPDPPKPPDAIPDATEEEIRTLHSCYQWIGTANHDIDLPQLRKARKKAAQLCVNYGLEYEYILTAKNFQSLLGNAHRHAAKVYPTPGKAVVWKNVHGSLSQWCFSLVEELKAQEAAIEQAKASEEELNQVLLEMGHPDAKPKRE